MDWWVFGLLLTAFAVLVRLEFELMIWLAARVLEPVARALGQIFRPPGE